MIEIWLNHPQSGLVELPTTGQVTFRLVFGWLEVTDHPTDETTRRQMIPAHRVSHVVETHTTPPEVF